MVNIKSSLVFLIMLVIHVEYPSAFATVINNYCKKQCKSFDGTTILHTMCKYPQNSPSKACTGHVNSGLTKKEKQTVLDLHNKLRRKVASGKEERGRPGPQPAAKKMPSLVWDDELEVVAQRWAHQCDFNHDCSDVDRFSVGQNIGQAWASPGFPEFTEMIQDWYDEVENYNRNEVSKFGQSRGVGHYTQMVWAETTKIGCGLTRYYDIEEAMNAAILVCNYGPAGNWRNRPVYEKL